jgi:hypothetical protein
MLTDEGARDCAAFVAEWRESARAFLTFEAAMQQSPGCGIEGT